jgi:hypothetical protein
MRHWIPEVHQHGLADAATNKTIETAGRGSHVTVIRANDVVPFLGLNAIDARHRLEQQFAR